MELGLAYGDRGTIQINIFDLQLQGLGDSEPRSGNETEQCAVHQRAQATSRGQAPRVLKQLADLLVGVDVWCWPSVAAAKDSGWRHFGVHLELTIVGREGSNDLEPSSCGNSTGSKDMLSRPFELKFLRQSSAVSPRVGESGEPQQLGAGGLQGEAKLTTLLEVAPHRGLYCGAGVHAALPGHGMATADNRPMSTLA